MRVKVHVQTHWWLQLTLQALVRISAHTGYIPSDRAISALMRAGTSTKVLPCKQQPTA